MKRLFQNLLASMNTSRAMPAAHIRHLCFLCKVERAPFLLLQLSCQAVVRKEYKLRGSSLRRGRENGRAFFLWGIPLWEETPRVAGRPRGRQDPGALGETAVVAPPKWSGLCLLALPQLRCDIEGIQTFLPVLLRGRMAYVASFKGGMALVGVPFFPA